MAQGDGPHDADRRPDAGAPLGEHAPGEAASTADSPVPGPTRRRRRRRGKRKRRRDPGSAVAGASAAAPLKAGATVPVPAAELVERAAADKPRAAEERTYAALDLGTNNCRLLIATPRERGFRVVDSFSRIVRLGEGVGRTGLLSAPAMDRAIEALKICRGKLERRHVTRTRLIATEACRLAANGEAFIARVAEETGLELEIVSRETEARLAATGCASLIDPAASGAILFDIGGGSSELVWLDLNRNAKGPRRRISEAIRAWQSLPVGVVNLSEHHGGRDVDDAVWEAMVADVAALLADFPEADALDEAAAGGGMHMLGTSGTVTTLAGVHLGLAKYDRRRVDGLWMSDDQIAEMIGRLRASDYDSRVANPCIGPDRADLVLAGCAILEAVRRRWPCDRMRVADRGLREGILTELMSADGAWRRKRRRRRSSGRKRQPANGAADG